ncbi:MAG TPA: hypothetical protein VII90_07730 [Anaerolineales bacterium]
MLNGFRHSADDVLKSDRSLILRYEGEDDNTYMVSNGRVANLVVPKNRSLPDPPLGRSASPLTPVFRLLLVAFLGLAPAGLGALVLAPLAALWALGMLATRRLGRADRIRVLVVWGMSAGLLGIAIPMSRLFLARIS